MKYEKKSLVIKEMKIKTGRIYSFIFVILGKRTPKIATVGKTVVNGNVHAFLQLNHFSEYCWFKAFVDQFSSIK